MKKLLFLSALVAGFAMAEEALADSDYVTYTSHVTYGNDGYANITTQHGTHEVQLSNPTFTCQDAAGAAVGYIGTTHAMDVEFGHGTGLFTLTLNFPVDAAYDEYTINNISVTLGLNNSDGTTYPLASYLNNNENAAPQVNLRARVLQDGKVLAEASKLPYTYYNSGSNLYTTGFNFGELYGNEEIRLTGSFTLEITVDDDIMLDHEGTNTVVTQSPFYVSIDNVEVSGQAPQNFSLVPEPTTATLSLLALAGLTARRRRK